MTTPRYSVFVLGPTGERWVSALAQEREIALAHYGYLLDMRAEGHLSKDVRPFGVLDGVSGEWIEGGEK